MAKEMQSKRKREQKTEAKVAAKLLTSAKKTSTHADSVKKTREMWTDKEITEFH